MSYWPFFYSIALQLVTILATDALAPRFEHESWAPLTLVLEPIAVFIACRRWIGPVMAGPESPASRYRRLLRGINIQLFAVVFTETICRLLYSASWFGTLFGSIPVYLLGVYYILTSRAPVSLRLVLGLWPLAVPLYFYGLYQMEMRTMVPEVYLIPTDYVGPVRVVLGDPAGAPAIFEGRRALLRVAPDGVLKTRLPLHYPRFPTLVKKWNGRRRFFYEDKLGRRRELATPARTKPRHAVRDIVVDDPRFEIGKDGQVAAIEFEILDKAEE